MPGAYGITTSVGRSRWWTTRHSLALRSPIPSSGGVPCGRRRLLEDLAEAVLQVLRILLDGLVVDRHELHLAERRIARRGRDVHPGGVDALVRKELLHGVTDH